MNIGYSVSGDKALMKKLKKLKDVSLQDELAETIRRIDERSKSNHRAYSTPKDTGALQNNVKFRVWKYEARYTYVQHYAPHVEYGHRLRNGKYLKGRYTFRANVSRARGEFYVLVQKKLKELTK